MINLRDVLRNTILVACLAISPYSSNLATTRAERSSSLTPGILLQEEPCTAPFVPQEIPEDGSWLRICWSDPSAPEGSFVKKVHIKYEVEHPMPDQLEIRVSRDEKSTGQEIWDKGVLVRGNEFGKAGDLEVFNGTSAQGNWYFLVRDSVLGEAGKLQDITIRPIYSTERATPAILSGTPSDNVTFRIPQDARRSRTPDWDPPKQKQSIAPSVIQTIKSETFEGAFPNSIWTLIDANPNDGKQYLWDDDNFRRHSGSWAAWPANGGANALSPATSSYPPNMASWMVYGPIDLSDAGTAEVSFWLWRQIETNFDSLFFGISPDNTNFYGYQWTGTAGWEQESIDISGYVGDSTVWIAWCFTSDSTIQYEGPWVDDILIQKEVPGKVTMSGTLSYIDRDGYSKLGAFTNVSLYENDPGGMDDLLATTSTNTSGYYTFPAITNWDSDWDADPSNRNLDLYLIFETDYNDSTTSRRKVTYILGQTYKWQFGPISDIPDGMNSFSIVIPNGPDVGAMWIFQDLRRAWKLIHETSPYYIDPGSVTAIWEDGKTCYPVLGCGSRFTPYTGVFISDDSVDSADIVVHEAGHNYMHNASGWIGNCGNHGIFVTSDIECAWSEGWADFLPLPVNLDLDPTRTDVCFDFHNGHCATGSADFENQSSADNFPDEDAVEGRIAGSLYDLYDNSNEGFDTAYFGFAPIIKIVLQGSREVNFLEFWNSWKASGQNKHHAVRAIYQNTIHYNTSPNISGLPDWNVPHESSWSDAFSLLNYSSDIESSLAELTWRVSSVSDARCGVTIDTLKNIDIVPQTGWQGSCDITILIDDSLATSNDQFTVNVTQASFADVPPSHRAYNWIERLFAAGFTAGCANNPRRYCPESTLTRADMSIFLEHGLHGGSYLPPTNVPITFTDTAGSYAVYWIEALKADGITAGCGGTKFCPNNNVTNSEMAVFLMRSKYGSSYVPPAATGSLFADMKDPNYWATTWAEQAYLKGLMPACSTSPLNFCPSHNIIRAEMAEYIVKTFNLP